MADAAFRHPYLPLTEAERAAMLADIGVGSFDELIAAIPQALRCGDLDLPASHDEAELKRTLTELSCRNVSTQDVASFLGAGAYQHYVPAVVDTIIRRGEFLTAYTPYQPEISQGTLQVIFEWQTMIAELTGLDVANASLYEGSSATAEGAFMAVNVTGRKAVLVLDTVHPHHRGTLRTYADGPGIAIREVATKAGRLDLAAVQAALGPDVAAVVVQYPSFLGTVDDFRPLAEAVHAAGALLVAVCEPVSLGMLAPPGDWGADVAVGEAQPLGNALSFGGPYVGFIAARDKLVRHLPGRLVGATTDASGKRAFTLTLQTREQHIRREKAASNICTNQALMALASTVYMSLMGPSGLRGLAEISFQRAHFLAERLAELPGFSLAFPQTPFFHEFVLRVPRPQELLQQLRRAGILGGVALAPWYPELSDALLVCVTEANRPEDLARYVEAARQIASGQLAPV